MIEMNLLFILFCVVFANISSVHSQRRIVGGDLVPIEDVPYQVALNKAYTTPSFNYTFFFCGGSLISERFVLTSKFCVSVVSTQEIYARFGSSNGEEDGVLIKVIQRIPHPKYIGGWDYDFALAKLASSPELPHVAKPIKLPAADDQIDVGTMTLISGYGDARVPGIERPLLRAVEIPVVDQKTCKEAHSYITDRMFCAGYPEGGKDACKYKDEGGPMVRISDQVLVGVISHGLSCGEPNLPGIYSKVSTVRGWIKEVADV